MRRTFLTTRRADTGKFFNGPMQGQRSAKALRALLFTALVLALPPTAAISGEPAGLATERTDLIPKDKARVEKIVKPTTDFSKPEQFERMQGGAGPSEKRVNQDAFSQSSANITFEEEGTFKLGNGMFRKLWVSSPSSTQASDGLGPLFNARACQSCHLKDGRGHPPEGGTDATSMFLRLARTAETSEEKAAIADRKVLNFPDPVYGGQFQDLAVPGLKGEGRMVVSYQQFPVQLSGDTKTALRWPIYSVTEDRTSVV